ncbi:MAG: hypothetical protein AB1483_09730 [Candidatus Zixiibacteriota bacterium]
MFKLSRFYLIAVVLSICTLQVLSVAAQEFEVPLEEQKRQANEALKESLSGGWLVASWIKHLLETGDFARVEEVLEGALQSYQENPQREAHLRGAYDLFCPAAGFDIELLNRWVDSTDSYAAYAARGTFLAQLAGSARGHQYIQYTAKENLETMADLAAEAGKDLLVAVEKKTSLVSAYAWLVILAKMTPMPYTAREMLDRALEQDKKTFYVRLQYMNSLLPRWGGSYEAMASFAMESIEYAELNPRLWILQGEIFADLAGYEWEDGNYNRSAEFYTMAMEFGETVRWLSYRAGCYVKLNRLKEALSDFERVLYYEPGNKKAQKWVPYLMASTR